MIGPGGDDADHEAAQVPPGLVTDDRPTVPNPASWVYPTAEVTMIDTTGIRATLAAYDEATSVYQAATVAGETVRDYENYEDVVLATGHGLAAALAPLVEPGTVLVQLTAEQYEIVRSALDDAWAYRLGEARDSQDPDLNPLDAAILAQQTKLAVPVDLFPETTPRYRPYGLDPSEY